MPRRIEKSRASRQDVLAIYLYIGQYSPSAAERFLESLEAAFSRLADMPRIGAPQEWRSPRLAEVRMWPVPRFRKYLIFYREADEAEIEILRVLHGARDLNRILADEQPD